MSSSILKSLTFSKIKSSAGQTNPYKCDKERSLNKRYNLHQTLNKETDQTNFTKEESGGLK